MKWLSTLKPYSGSSYLNYAMTKAIVKVLKKKAVIRLHNFFEKNAIGRLWNFDRKIINKMLFFFYLAYSLIFMRELEKPKKKEKKNVKILYIKNWVEPCRHLKKYSYVCIKTQLKGKKITYQ